MGYIGWSLLGMAGYSAVTLFVKLATRGGALSAFQVLGIAVAIVGVGVWSILAAQGGLTGRAWNGTTATSAGFAIAAGIALTIAVASLFKALSVGPASVVVPIYGMFILGGSVLGMVFLGEPLTLRKLTGLVLAVAGVVLIAG